jgi:ATP-dependent DNA ligase
VWEFVHAENLSFKKKRGGCRADDERVWLCAFDLLELNGEDLRQKPLVERKKRLGGVEDKKQ